VFTCLKCKQRERAGGDIWCAECRLEDTQRTARLLDARQKLAKSVLKLKVDGTPEEFLASWMKYLDAQNKSLDKMLRLLHGWRLDNL
jgi:hypothetical protein